MSVSQDSYTFGGSNLSHGDIRLGSPDIPIQTGQWFGVQGEAHLIGATYGCDMWLECMLIEFETAALCWSKIYEIRSKIGTLTGSVTIVTGSLTNTLNAATFVRAEFESPAPTQPFLSDPYCARGMLMWRQR